MQTIKSHKLSKSRSNGRLAKSSSDSPAGGELTFRTSIDDLRNPDGRQNLRHHFTGAFPETRLRPSMDSFHASDADSKSGSGLSPSTSSDTTAQTSLAASSPSSDSLHLAALKRLSTVRESNPPAFDISQAIKLLEEIKKTATAAELVALHKALLPSRDSALHSPGLPPSQEELANVPAAGFVRRRSMLPPGLATRNASGDLLRTPEEAAADKTRPSSRHSKKTDPTKGSSVNGPIPPTHLRPATPSDYDDNVHMGAYGPGTLRITNGPASPEPSIVMRKSVDHFETAPSTPVNGRATLARPKSLHYKPSHDSTASFHTAYQPTSTRDLRQYADPEPVDPREYRKERRLSEPAMSGIPVPEDRDDSAPRLYRPSRLEKKPKSCNHSREASRTRPARSRANSQSCLPIPVEVPAVAQQVVTDPMPLAERFDQPKGKGSEPLTYEGMVLPASADILRPNKQIDMPRFAQRLSYRISQISQEAATNSQQLPPSPSENDAALAHLSRRLGSVTDGASRAQDSSRPAASEGTPEAALAKLSGLREHPAYRYSEEQVRSSDITLIPDLYTESPIQDQSRPSFPGKVDSGYVSDGLPGWKESRDASHVATTAPNAHDSKASLTKRFHVPGLNPSQDDVSLYSFRAVLNTPDFFETIPTRPSPTPLPSKGTRKNRLSFLSRSKRSASVSTPSTTNRAADLSTSRDSSPVTKPKASKSQKKLQKAMPAAVRQELRAQKKHQQLEASTICRSSHDRGIIPDVPEHVAMNFKRRSHLAPEAVSVHEEDSVTPSEPMELLASVPVEISEGNEQSGIESGVSGRTEERDSMMRPRAQPTSNARSRSTSSTREEAVSRPSAEGGFGSTRPSCDLVTHSSQQAHPIKDYQDQVAQHPAPVARLEDVTRTKPAVFIGMPASAASELARLRSRDVAMQGGEEMYDTPKTATPRSRKTPKEEHSSGGGPLAGGTQAYSDCRNLYESGGVSRSPSSVAESIPPLPRIPSHVNARVSKIDGQVARRLRESQIRDSAAAGSSESDLSGFSTESVADAVKRAVQAKKAPIDPPADLPISEVVRMYKSKAAKKKAKKSNRGREEDSHGLDDELEQAATDAAGPEKVETDAVEVVPAAPDARTESSEDLPGGWEDYVKAWRHRRQSAGEKLGKPVVSETKEGRPTMEHLRTLSTSSVHTIARKPVRGGNRESTTPKPDETTSGTATPTLHRRSGSAELQAEAYRDLIAQGEKKDDVGDKKPALGRRPTYDGEEFAGPLDDGPAEKEGPKVVDSAYTTKPYELLSGSSIERARSPGGRVVTLSGNYHPYVPRADVPDPAPNSAIEETKETGTAEKAETEDEIQLARAISLARLTGTTSIEAKDIPKPLPKRLTKPPVDGKAKTPPPRSSKPPKKRAPGAPSSSPHHRKSSSTASGMIIGRYSGGLELGYHAGEGFGGSAGTRTVGEARPRAKRQISSGFLGVDLSDVPFLAPEISS